MVSFDAMPNKINYGRLASLQNYGPYATEDDEVAIAQVSGGRTSAYMACFLSDHVYMTFQNTGLEHPKTLEFLMRLEDALQREILWLEYRPPARYGAPPCEARFEIVNFDTAARKGEPFIAMLQALAAYRKLVKDAPPVSPWPRGRICTSHLKHKIKDRFMAQLGFTAYATFVGLRADESSRVVKLREEATSNKTFRVPMYEAGVTKPQVLEFWSQQSFNLEIPDAWGNCSNCFLKDRGDIARNLGDPEGMREVWFYLQDNFPSFGGRNFPGYRRLDEERQIRLAIEAALRDGQPEPPRPENWTNRKYLAVLRDEKERFENGPAPFSCACEASFNEDYGDV